MSKSFIQWSEPNLSGWLSTIQQKLLVQPNNQGLLTTQLGLRTLDGIGKGIQPNVIKTREKIVESFREATAQGCGFGFYMAGLCEMFGFGTRRDLGKGFQAITWAADGEYFDDPHAQHHLSIHFYQENPTKAFQYSSLSAEQALPAALRTNGLMHVKGVGTATNLIEGIIKLQEAAALGEPNAKTDLEVITAKVRQLRARERQLMELKQRQERKVTSITSYKDSHGSQLIMESPLEPSSSPTTKPPKQRVKM